MYEERGAGGWRKGKETNGKGNIEVTREGEDNPELDHGEPGNIVATREGEDNPELDQVEPGDIGATREE